MKKAIILLIAVLSFCCIPDVFASDMIVVKDDKDCKECITFNNIIARYNSLKADSEPRRNNSEAAEAYKNRLKKSKECLSAFLNTVYEGKFDLDAVSIDWGNNLLLITREFPFEYTWEGGDLCRKMSLSITLPHLKLRELVTFKKYISYVITFKLNENGVMQCMHLKVVYRGEEIISETDLSSV